MRTQQVKPFHLFFDIKRVDEEKRTVEAYAFVNEVVEGEGGIRLKRTAMEAATPDYMEWANVRRMHQADAVGVAHAVDWDDKGAKMSLEVVDEDAWDKVKKRVYKGLSVGVAATVMRGKDVEKCRWIETSLVDRPKDPDAKILAFRADDGDSEEFEAEVLDDEIPEERGLTSGDVPVRENLEGGKPQKQTVYHCGIEYHRHTTEGGAQECIDRQAQMIDEQIEYYEQQLSAMKAKKRAEEGEIERAEGDPDPTVIERTESDPPAEIPETEEADAITRAEVATTELTRVQGLLSAAEAEIQRLKKLPAQIAKPPVRYPAAFNREFAANEGNGAVSAEETNAEIKRIEELAKNEPDQHKRQQYAGQIVSLQQRLALSGQETITR